MMTSVNSSLRAATLLMVGIALISARTADAGFTSVTSSNTNNQQVSLDYSGTARFVSGTFAASIFTDSIKSIGSSTLTFTYDGLDFIDRLSGVRPVFNFVNNTGVALTGLSFTLEQGQGTSFFNFVNTGVVGDRSFLALTERSVSGTSYTLPTSLAAGASFGVYGPIGVSRNSGSFTLTIATIPSATAVPEPSSLALCGLACGLGLTVARVRRQQVA